jgi:hypothetical protein
MNAASWVTAKARHRRGSAPASAPSADITRPVVGALTAVDSAAIARGAAGRHRGCRPAWSSVPSLPAGITIGVPRTMPYTSRGRHRRQHRFRVTVSRHDPAPEGCNALRTHAVIEVPRTAWPSRPRRSLISPPNREHDGPATRVWRRGGRVAPGRRPAWLADRTAGSPRNMPRCAG